MEVDTRALSPTVIRTAKDLEALADCSVLLDNGGTVWQKSAPKYWKTIGTEQYFEPWHIELPALYLARGNGSDRIE